MKRPPFYYISPCLIAAAICVIGIVWGLAYIKGSDGWSLIFVVMFASALLILLIADLVVKLLVTKRVLYIWLIEIVLVVIAVFVFKPFIF
jgi:hypothetical protein